MLVPPGLQALWPSLTLVAQGPVEVEAPRVEAVVCSMRCGAHVFLAPGKLDRATNTLALVGRNRRSVQRVSERPEADHRPPHSDPPPPVSCFTDGEPRQAQGKGLAAQACAQRELWG